VAGVVLVLAAVLVGAAGVVAVGEGAARAAGWMRK
jgi:hypothetical protein